MVLSSAANPLREEVQKPKREALEQFEQLSEGDTVQQLIRIDDEHDEHHEHDHQLIVQQDNLAWRQDEDHSSWKHQIPTHHEHLVVEKKIPFPVKIPVPVTRTVTVEKHVPIKVYKPIYIEKKVHVPHKVIVEKRIPVLIERLVQNVQNGQLMRPNSNGTNITVSVNDVPVFNSVSDPANRGVGGAGGPVGAGGAGGALDPAAVQALIGGVLAGIQSQQVSLVPVNTVGVGGGWGGFGGQSGIGFGPGVIGGGFGFGLGGVGSGLIGSGFGNGFGFGTGRFGGGFGGNGIFF